MFKRRAQQYTCVFCQHGNRPLSSSTRLSTELATKPIPQTTKEVAQAQASKRSTNYTQEQLQRQIELTSETDVFKRWMLGPKYARMRGPSITLRLYKKHGLAQRKNDEKSLKDARESLGALNYNEIELDERAYDSASYEENTAIQESFNDARAERNPRRRLNVDKEQGYSPMSLTEAMAGHQPHQMGNETLQTPETISLPLLVDLVHSQIECCESSEDVIHIVTIMLDSRDGMPNANGMGATILEMPKIQALLADRAKDWSQRVALETLLLIISRFEQCSIVADRSLIWRALVLSACCDFRPGVEKLLKKYGIYQRDVPNNCKVLGRLLVAAEGEQKLSGSDSWSMPPEQLNDLLGALESENTGSTPLLIAATLSRLSRLGDVEGTWLLWQKHKESLISEALQPSRRGRRNRKSKPEGIAMPRQLFGKAGLFGTGAQNDQTSLRLDLANPSELRTLLMPEHEARYPSVAQHAIREFAFVLLRLDQPERAWELFAECGELLSPNDHKLWRLFLKSARKRPQLPKDERNLEQAVEEGYCHYLSLCLAVLERWLGVYWARGSNGELFHAPISQGRGRVPELGTVEGDVQVWFDDITPDTAFCKRLGSPAWPTAINAEASDGCWPHTCIDRARGTA